MAGKRSFGSIRALPSGKFQARYIGPDGSEHKAPHTFTAQIDAEGWLSRERVMIEREEWTPPATRTAAQASGGLTVKVYADRWHEETVNRHKPRTRVLNRGYLDNVIYPGLGDKRLTTLTVSEVREWHAGLDATYPTRNANAYSLLRTILNQAVDDEILDVNPCRVKRAAVKHRKSEPVALTAAEIRAMAAAILPRYKALVLLAGFSGLRFGELTALRRSDLTMTTGNLSVTVKRAVVRVQGEWITDRPKSRAALRTVPLPEGLRADLVAHLATYSGKGAAGLVFPAQGGGILHRDTIKEPFADAAEAIGHWCDLVFAAPGSADTSGRYRHGVHEAATGPAVVGVARGCRGPGRGPATTGGVGATLPRPRTATTSGRLGGLRGRRSLPGGPSA